MTKPALMITRAMLRRDFREYRLLQRGLMVEVIDSLNRPVGEYRRCIPNGWTPEAVDDVRQWLVAEGFHIPYLAAV